MQKDILYAVLGIILFAVTMAYCSQAKAVEGLYLEFGFSADHQKTMGRNPVGTITAGYKFLPCIHFQYHHLSSVRDEQDKNTFDAFQLVYRMDFDNGPKCK